MVLINSYRMDDESDHFVVISNMIRSSEMVFGCEQFGGLDW